MLPNEPDAARENTARSAVVWGFRKLIALIRALVLAVLTVFGAFFFMDWLQADDIPTVIYAWKHNAYIDVITPEPHDCEFLAAPIGDKYCHYKPIYEVSGPSDLQRARGQSERDLDIVGWSKIKD